MCECEQYDSLCIPMLKEPEQRLIPESEVCLGSLPLGSTSFERVVSMCPFACGHDWNMPTFEYRSKPLCITQGVINLIISKAPLVFHEGHAPGCGLEYNCRRFQ